MIDESNNKQILNIPELNEKMIIETIKETISSIEHKTIIEGQEFIKKILQHYVVSDSSEEKLTEIPNLNEWNEGIIKNVNEVPLKISESGIETIQKINESLIEFENIYKQTCNTKKNFHHKLISEIESESTTIWSNMINWINENLTELNEENQLTNKTINRIASNWVDNIKQNLERLLESAIKDYLHSLVNKSIILSKITGKNGWKEKMATYQIKDHRLIQSIEKEIKNDLKKITTEYDAPFMETFSNELYTRCYKHLVSPIVKSEEPTTISELTSDMKTKSIKKFQWPKDIQEEFDIEYLEFLKTICNNKPNIKIYAKIKFKSLKSIAKNTTLSDIEKKEIQNIYFKIYKLSRRYEKLLTVLEDKNKTIIDKNHEEVVKTICNNIEMAHHGFRPFLMSFIQQLQLSFQMANRNLRKTNISEYTESLKALQKITETLELTRLLNQFFEKNASVEKLNEDEWLKKFLNNKKTSLKKSIEPWGNHDWNEFLNHIIELIEIKKQPKSKRRIIDNTLNYKETHVSNMVEKPPKLEVNSKTNSTLNNQI